MVSKEEIKPVKESIQDKLLAIAGVKGVDIGYKKVNGRKTNELAIRVMVEKKKNEKDIPIQEIIPKEIEGIKTDVIERKLVPLIHRMNLTNGPSSITEIHNPLFGGLGISPCRLLNGEVYTGTLGMIVYDNDTSRAMLLSNYHVLCMDNKWQIGDGIVEPSLAHGGRCPEYIVGRLQRGVLNNKVDCAVASIESRNSISEIGRIGNISKIGIADTDMRIKKSGAVTGLTYGIIDGVNGIEEIDYGNELGKILFTNLISIEVDESINSILCKSGDSGSVVVNDSNELIGLHCVGDENGTYMACNPIQEVFTALNVYIK